MEAGTTPPAQTPPTALTTDDLLRAIIAEQQQNRAAVAALQEELAATKRPVPAAPSVALTPEEAMASRMADIAQHSHYCPGCGLLYDYPQKCTGRSEAPHQPIEVVSTDELKAGDSSKYTPAPVAA